MILSKKYCPYDGQTISCQNGFIIIRDDGVSRANLDHMPEWGGGERVNLPVSIVEKNRFVPKFYLTFVFNFFRKKSNFSFFGYFEFIMQNET